MMGRKIFVVFLLAVHSCCFSYSQKSSQSSSFPNSQLNSCASTVIVPADYYYQLQFDTVGVWFNNPCWGFNSYIGQEYIARFTPPCTNTYRIEFSSLYWSSVSMSIRAGGSSCDSTGFTCVNINYNGNSYYADILLQDTITYDFLFDYDGQYGILTGNVIIRIPHITNFEAHHITPDSIGFYWNGTFDNVVLEYGKKGFVPGTDTLPGSMGTVINNATSPTFIFGLEMDSVYDFYYRDKCGAFGANLSRRLRVPANCDSLPTIVSGSTFIFPNISNPMYGESSWAINACNANCVARSKEKILNFTPTTSGMYIVRGNVGGFTGPQLFIFYKEASLGCDEYNWICGGTGGTMWNWGAVFGQLDSGTTYYILCKGTQDECIMTGWNNIYYTLEGPSQCFAPSLPRPFAVTTTSIQVSSSWCSFCLGTLIIEYGPLGFTPGFDSLPGLGGTVIFAPKGLYTIQNLQPGTTYDIYMRQICDSVNMFSDNSSFIRRTTIAVCSNSPTILTTNAPNNTICGTQSVYFSASGGILSPTGHYVWTTDSCDGPVIATGGNGAGSFTVSSTKEYFIHAQDTCGNNSCVSVTVNVNPLPSVSIAPTGSIPICQGDTVNLTATTSVSNTYQWYRNNVLITGATAANYLATTTGSYYAKVTDTVTCTKNSTSTAVTIVCYPIRNPPNRYSAGMDSDVFEITIEKRNNEIVFANTIDKNASIYIYNSLGQLMQRIKPDWNLEFVSLSTFDWNAGIYFIYVQSSVQKSAGFKINIVR